MAAHWLPGRLTSDSHPLTAATSPTSTHNRPSAVTHTPVRLPPSASGQARKVQGRRAVLLGVCREETIPFLFWEDAKLLAHRGTTKSPVMVMGRPFRPSSSCTQRSGARPSGLRAQDELLTRTLCRGGRNTPTQTSRGPWRPCKPGRAGQGREGRLRGGEAFHKPPLPPGQGWPGSRAGTESRTGDTPDTRPAGRGPTHLSARPAGPGRAPRCASPPRRRSDASQPGTGTHAHSLCAPGERGGRRRPRAGSAGPGIRQVSPR